MQNTGMYLWIDMTPLQVIAAPSVESMQCEVPGCLAIPHAGAMAPLHGAFRGRVFHVHAAPEREALPSWRLAISGMRRVLKGVWLLLLWVS